MEASNLRFIVFAIDSKYKDHDGKVFLSKKDAENFAVDLIKEKYSDKAIIGMFYNDSNAKEMLITLIQTLGFNGDKKNLDQLELF